MSLVERIIPQPVFVEATGGHFRMTDETPLIIGNGCTNAGRLIATLFNLKIVSDAQAPAFTVYIDSDVKAPEGYRLSVTPSEISLTAAAEAGLFHGAQTLRQLLPTSMVAGRIDSVDIPTVVVDDYPQFKWRAMHLDVGRHMFPVSFIKRYIDLMAMHKMNIFHWHLTEDQGWRIAIDRYPKLTEVGAWRKESPLLHDRNQGDGTPYGGSYSKDDIREIVAYAHSLGITVMPEIELPGHAVAALAAYPQLGCVGSGYEVRTTWGIADDVFCAGNDEVFTFLRNVIDEVLELFPSPYIHIGGDECPKIRWQCCDRCQARIKTEGLADEEALQSWFITQIGRYLDEKGRKMIGWDEILEGGYRRVRPLCHGGAPKGDYRGQARS